MPAWNGWQSWQRSQAVKAGAMYDELDRAAAAGDAARVTRAFADIKERYPRTAYAEQAALLAAKSQFDQGKVDEARAALAWAADNAVEDEYRAIARLRLAGILYGQKQYDEALRQLDAAASSKEFAALRRRPARRRAARQGRPQCGQVGLRERLEADGRRPRLPPTGRRQADRPRCCAGRAGSGGLGGGRRLAVRRRR